jgi:cephalosporin hydroxylase
MTDLTKNLHKYFVNNTKKKLHKWFHYFDIYEKYLSKYQNTPAVLLEIGIDEGGSLLMWKNYLGKDSKIIGLDINPKCKNLAKECFEIYIGNQNDENIINEIKKNNPKIDIVIDDGSHNMEDMIASFEFLYDFIDSNGIYIAEDTHTSYWKDYGGGFGKEDTFIEYAKKKIDELHLTQRGPDIEISKFAKTTNNINFYDSIVVFEKKIQGKRRAPVTGPL